MRTQELNFNFGKLSVITSIDVYNLARTMENAKSFRQTGLSTSINYILIFATDDKRILRTSPLYILKAGDKKEYAKGREKICVVHAIGILMMASNQHS